MTLGLEGLASMGPWAAAAIAAKALGYATALLAMGGALFLAVFRAELGHGLGDGEGVARGLRRLTAVAAVLGLAVLALRVEIRAARISGMGPAGMVDPMMLGIVWDSPLGSAGVWRIAGLALVLAVLWGGAAGTALSLVGAALVAMSYTQVGHSLDGPRWALGTLLTMHLLAAAYWVGALWPLRRAAALGPGAAALLHRFGIVATGVVALLAAMGATFAWLMVGGVAGLVGTAYGWTLLLKVALVAGLTGLAALNKLRLVPALAAGRAEAAPALRRSIAAEIAVVAVILLLTATLTTLTTPPVNL